MKTEPDAAPSAPARKPMKFKPKVPPRKLAKKSLPKLEPVETEDDVVNKELLTKLNSAKAHDGFGKRASKNERKVSALQVAIGYGSASTLARSYGNPKGSAMGHKLQEGLDPSIPSMQKEYVEPWDYAHSYYPVSLPLRRPYSGDPETLNELEFGTVTASSALDESSINAAAELGLMEDRHEASMIFFQLPASLPIVKQSDVDVKSKGGGVSKKGYGLEELPAGYMGKMLIYKSGAVKMKLGDALFDVSPGLNCVFAQDVAAINTEEKHCCILGELDKRAMVTPDVDFLLDSIENTKLHES